MKNNMNKRIIQILSSVVIFVALYFGVKHFIKPAETVVGDKAIKITILDKESEKALEETFNTDTELLGELLDEINEKKEEIFVFEGAKTDEFGRFISEIKLVEKESGEFWVYDSDNNEVCKAEGFCPGVDQLAIKDGNNFEFSVIKP